MTWPGGFVEKFWSRVDRRGPDECWPWKAHVLNSGYGNYNGLPAHRLALMFSDIEIPDRHVVRHKCNNKLCVNPAHLHTGTHGDNLRDAYRDGRRSHKGSSHPRSKLTDIQVREILSLTNISYKDIAKQYAISPSIISMIKNRKIWTHIEVSP